MMSDILDVKDLTIKYGRNIAVDNLSFKVRRGDYLGIVGPNGSGKTSLINAILRIIKPAEGSISLSDHISLGYLPQKSIKNDRLFPAKVKEIVATGLMARKKGLKFFSKEDYEKVDKILRELNIYDLIDRKIGQLSGGQQQRVLLARAMIGSPNILILDEPTNYLDQDSREDLYKTLKELNEKKDVTVIVVSHDLQTIGKYINRILYMETKLKFFGTYKEFLKSKNTGNHSNPMEIDD